MNIDVLRYEFIHFCRNKGKVYSFFFFLTLCVYALVSDYGLMSQQLNTISKIEGHQQQEISEVKSWFKSGKMGPEDKSWVNIEDPYWAIIYTPSFIFKSPSKLFPLGLGQSENYGYYKKISRWSSTYDTDMIEETSNYEKLANGNLDFSFLVIFILPILLIILTYNINGLEKDLKFDKLISIQTKKINRWILYRLLFYFLSVIITINFLISSIFLISGSLIEIDNVIKIVLLSNIYILFFFLIFYFTIITARSTNSILIKMITLWIVLCVIIPGSVHQYASLKYPVNYNTDFLDANRKETYEIFKLENDTLFSMIKNVYPNLYKDETSINSKPTKKIIRRSISSIVNQLQIDAATEIESQNEMKNNFIKKSYFFNPVVFVQNKWNSYTSNDYYSFKSYRNRIQDHISKRNELLVFELWNQEKVNLETYEDYLKELKPKNKNESNE